jgi:hypothetical protein
LLISKEVIPSVFSLPIFSCIPLMYPGAPEFDLEFVPSKYLTEFLREIDTIEVVGTTVILP